jgi:beta-lactamase regulating signal transducer with metallopeptidase domain
VNYLFIRLLNNTFVASVLIIAVIITRILIRKAPKWISCALWGLVAIRLVFPFSIESVLSLIPSAEPIPVDIEYQAVPQIESGVPVINHVVNPVIESNFTPQTGFSVNPLQVALFIAEIVWCVGIVVLCVYAIISYIVLRKKVAVSQKVFDNVYVCDEVSSPFILGIVRARIYLPSGMDSEARECVLEHERAHIKRFDHLWKPVGFIILAVYWFNPLCWAAYVLLCKDIELACDEKVTKDKDRAWKATYCQALLDCKVNRRIITACPVAFGEVSVKDRIKSVLNYKKPSFWIIISAIVICAVVAVCFMTSPKKAVDNGVEIEYVPAVVDKDTISGADGAMIACGNDECIVFYDYYGLFVVDVINRQFKTSLDLQSIGCSATQGDEACEIFMGEGDNILIHAMNSDSMYVFNYSDNTVKETEYDEAQCVADKNIVDLADYLYLDYTKFQGRQAYIFNDEGAENIVWLESGSGMPIDMALHIRNNLTDKADEGSSFYIFKEGEISDDDSSVNKKVYAEGTFDNIMGYSGYYVYFEAFPVEGYYYSDDGTLLAEVWGTEPEDVGMVDLNGDGKNELVSELIYGDGATRVVVYSEFEDGIRYAFVSDTTDEKYYNSTWFGEIICEYLKDTNEVKFSYWVEEEQDYNKVNTIPIDFEALTWWTAEWVDNVTVESYDTYNEDNQGEYFYK